MAAELITKVPDTFRKSESPIRDIFVLPGEAYARMAKDLCNLLNAAVVNRVSNT
jgi:hypothetical protein